MYDGWARYGWTKSNRVTRLYEKKRKLVSGNSKKDWFRHCYGESSKSVGRHAEFEVGPQKFAAHKRHIVFYMKCHFRA